MGCCASTDENRRIQEAVAQHRIRTTTIRELEEDQEDRHGELEKYRFGGLLRRVREDVFIYGILPYLSGRDVVVNVGAVNSAYRGAAKQSAAWGAWLYPRMDPAVLVALALECEDDRASLLDCTEFWSPGGRVSRHRFDLTNIEECMLIGESPMGRLGSPLIVTSLPSPAAIDALGDALWSICVDGWHVGQDMGSVDLSLGRTLENPTIADIIVLELAMRIPQLRSLKLVKPVCGLSPRAAQDLNCEPHLDFNGSCLEMVATLCPMLEAIDVSECRQLSNEAMIAFSSVADELKSITAANVRLSADTLSNVVASSSSLTKLDISRSTSEAISNELLLKLAERCGDNLRHLNVGYTVHNSSPIDDAAVIELATKCPNLEFLDVSGAKRVTGASIAEFGKRCRDLRHLGISNVNPGGMEEAIRIVAGNCPFLEVFHAAGVASQTAVEAVIRGCPLLRDVSVGVRDGIGRECYLAIVASCPKLESITAPAGYPAKDQDEYGARDGCH